MIEKLTLIKERLIDVKVNRRVYNFPRLLKELRRCFGSTRRSICKDLDIGEMRMYSLENGTFGGLIKDQEIQKLSEYYGMDKKFLMDKAKCFVAERKGKSHVEYGIDT